MIAKLQESCLVQENKLKEPKMSVVACPVYSLCMLIFEIPLEQTCSLDLGRPGSALGAENGQDPSGGGLQTPQSQLKSMYELKANKY